MTITNPGTLPRFRRRALALGGKLRALIYQALMN